MADPELTHHDSIGGLLRGILIDVRELVREELALARFEMREQANRARLAIAILAAAAVALALGTVFLLIAMANGIAYALGWPVWAGYLMVALLLAIGGTVGLTAGRQRLRNVTPVPQETVATLKENSQWIAKRLSSEHK
jgi:protein-S-isoprenylcysteine O-methyltransferase Ste14